MQGTFGDPHYGGNIGGKGWDIIRYPGPRPATSPDMQRMDKDGRSRIAAPHGENQ